MTCEYGKIIKTKFFDQKFWMVQRGNPWDILKKWQKFFFIFFPKRFVQKNSYLTIAKTRITVFFRHPVFNTEKRSDRKIVYTLPTFYLLYLLFTIKICNKNMLNLNIALFCQFYELWQLTFLLSCPRYLKLCR